jgi:SAM-dependent methyltransferase
VLNCFSYTGGFSVNAALGGATRVFSVDQDADAIALARENFARNGLDPNAHDFLAADVFELLASFRQEGRTFDLVILDPPAFAKSQRAVQAALDGYASLNRQALGVVAPGGILMTASCSAASPRGIRGRGEGGGVQGLGGPDAARGAVPAARPSGAAAVPRGPLPQVPRAPGDAMVSRGQYLERPALIPLGAEVLEGLWHRGERTPPLLIVPPPPGTGSMDHVVCAELAWAAARAGYPVLRFNSAAWARARARWEMLPRASRMRTRPSAARENTDTVDVVVAVVGESLDTGLRLAQLHPPPGVRAGQPARGPGTGARLGPALCIVGALEPGQAGLAALVQQAGGRWCRCPRRMPGSCATPRSAGPRWSGWPDSPRHQDREEKPGGANRRRRRA